MDGADLAIHQLKLQAGGVCCHMWSHDICVTILRRGCIKLFISPQEIVDYLFLIRLPL